ncbi:hypothetical protein HJC23_011223 [Cyclotella cryptica]|uniref:SAM-dependent MTase RsmB/NOP-type domain-containing protein n=1 Tax=Cyclotella cryptica TaxID=29204 RepID=A0ABD3PVN5_9STRA
MQRRMARAILIAGAALRFRYVNQYAFSFELQSMLPNHPPGKRSIREISSGLYCQRQPTSDSRRVAILLPSDSNLPWYEEAISHLQRIEVRLELPIFSPRDPSHYNNHDGSSHDNDEVAPFDYSHLLTAVPYPGNTYALAIHNNSPQSTSSKRKRKPQQPSKTKLDPLFVDLCPPSDTRLGYRMNQMDSSGAGGEELLLKALGLKKMITDRQLDRNQEPLVIYDLTAGLARDSLIILNAFVGNGHGGTPESLPLRLHMIERDRIVASLVLDAMRRLRLVAQLNDTPDTRGMRATNAQRLLQCLTMEEGDAIEILERSSSGPCEENRSVLFPPDVCYLDPMFPPRKKKASAVKKDMSMLHSLLGTAEMKKSDTLEESYRIKEERDLLRAAYNSARSRVVVKRPIAAPPLGYLTTHDIDKNVIKPSYDIRGSVNRWDVYVV